MARTNNPTEHGLHVFEWDGINDNGYGNGSPISIYPVVKEWSTGYTETIAVDDIDNDGKQEVVYVSNGSGTNDGVFIISCNGEFSLGNVTWVEEASFKRTEGYFSGSPYTTAISDLDNDGNKEAIIGLWDDGSFLIIESTSVNHYVKRAYFETTPGTDDICLKNIIVTDFDKDGKDDILFNLYNQKMVGLVYNITSLEALNTNANIEFIFKNEHGACCGIAYGDQDDNAIENLFLSQFINGSILEIEYNGTGDRLSSNNYNVHQLFIDYSGLSEGSFALTTPSVDLDGDGLKEVIATFIDSDEDPNKKWFRVFESLATSVKEWHIVTQKDFKLFQNFPNPFNISTRIEFELPIKKKVTLKIFNINGKLVRNLICNEELTAGHHGIFWNGKNDKNENVSSGVYIYRLSYGNFNVSKRMAILK